jgi:hypothetical protein
MSLVMRSLALLALSVVVLIAHEMSTRYPKELQ